MSGNFILLKDNASVIYVTVDNVNANTLNIKETIKFLYAHHIKRPITMN